MNHRKPLASLTARSAAIMGILTVLALAGALFALYVLRPTPGGLRAG